MAITREMFTSQTEEWGTPLDLFQKLDDEFGFELDVCASEDNAKCKRFFTKQDDGLGQEWSGVCWMNPPYGREIKYWMSKAVDSWRGGATVVCLVPARTDTKWWHEFAMQGEIRFLRGRLRFTSQDGETGGSAPFPSAIVILRSEKRETRVNQWT